jgi:hypothetical protein
MERSVCLRGFILLIVPSVPPSICPTALLFRVPNSISQINRATLAGWLGELFHEDVR